MDAISQKKIDILKAFASLVDGGTDVTPFLGSECTQIAGRSVGVAGGWRGAAGTQAGRGVVVCWSSRTAHDPPPSPPLPPSPCAGNIRMMLDCCNDDNVAVVECAVTLLHRLALQPRYTTPLLVAGTISVLVSAQRRDCTA